MAQNNGNQEAKERITLGFRNEKHRTLFLSSLRRMNKKDKAAMSALYLLTADNRLWQTAKRYICGNRIPLRKMRLRAVSEDSYTLFCCAKDLLYGTNYLTVSDLGDRELISPRILKVIYNAVAIRRLGIENVQREEE